MTPREEWRAAYRAVRRRGATGRELFACICDAMGMPHTNDWIFSTDRGLTALNMQQCLKAARRTEPPLFQSLAETVLNRFGTKNPWGNRIDYGSRAWRISEQARKLSERMKEGGRLQLDRGGWVRGVRA